MSVELLAQKILYRNGSDAQMLSSSTAKKTAALLCKVYPKESMDTQYERAAYTAWDLDGRATDRGPLWGEHLLHGSKKIHTLLQLKLRLRTLPEEIEREIVQYIPIQTGELCTSYTMKHLFNRFCNKREHAEIRKILKEAGIETHPERKKARDFVQFIKFMQRIDTTFYSGPDAPAVSPLQSSLLKFEDEMAAEYIKKAYAQSVSSILSHYTEQQITELWGDRNKEEYTEYENARYLSERFEARAGTLTQPIITLHTSVAYKVHRPQDGELEAYLQTLPGLVTTNTSAIFLPKEMLVDGLLYVSLINQPLKELPEEVFSLQNLQSLLLDNCPLESLSPRIKELTALQSLQILGGRLTTIPKELSGMDIVSLVLSNNRIASLPEELYLPELSDLHLPHNPISSLPAALFRSAKLENLVLHNCAFTEIPEGIKYLEKLDSLHMSDNSITAIPDIFQHIPQVHAIHLEDNKIEEIPEFLTEQFNALGYSSTGGKWRFYFSRNPLQNITDEQRACFWIYDE